jgi:hypothetical protein
LARDALGDCRMSRRSQPRHAGPRNRARQERRVRPLQLQSRNATRHCWRLRVSWAWWDETWKRRAHRVRRASCDVGFRVGCGRVWPGGPPPVPASMMIVPRCRSSQWWSARRCFSSPVWARLSERWVGVECPGRPRSRGHRVRRCSGRAESRRVSRLAVVFREHRSCWAIADGSHAACPTMPASWHAAARPWSRPPRPRCSNSLRSISKEATLGVWPEREQRPPRRGRPGPTRVLGGAWRSRPPTARCSLASTADSFRRPQRVPVLRRCRKA